MKYLILIFSFVFLSGCHSTYYGEDIPPIKTEVGNTLTTKQILEKQDSATFAVVGSELYVLQDGVVVHKAIIELRSQYSVDISATITLVVFICVFFVFVGAALNP